MGTRVNRQEVKRVTSTTRVIEQQGTAAVLMAL